MSTAPEQLDTPQAGLSLPPGPSYLVGREAIREFAAAVGAGHPWHHDVVAARAAGQRDVVAPPTFAVVVAQRSEMRLLASAAPGIDLSRVVHGEESFTHHAPIVAGDELVATPSVDAVRTMGGHTVVTTRHEVATVAGDPRCTVVSTLVVRGPAGDGPPGGTPAGSTGAGGGDAGSGPR